jgi:activator of HSP90 ATPase
MKTKKLQQTISFVASPHEIYEVLMDSKKHSDFTGAAAVISQKIGGTFTVFDKYAAGKNIELIPDKKIVQTWRADDWPQNHYSTVTFDLKPNGKETIVEFTQIEIPETFYEEIKQGWIEWYWDKLKLYFKK